MLRPHAILSRQSILCALCLVSPYLARAEPPCCSLDQPCTKSSLVQKTYRNGSWFIVETANFQVCARPSEQFARRLATQAEHVRAELQARWFGADPEASWNPKCQIVVHASRQAYVAAVGRGSEQTVGSSAVSVREGQICARRIDLLTTHSALRTPALAHELTHVLLKDRFPDSVIPPWADEGVAILADAEDKQARHLHDLQAALQRHETFGTATLLATYEYPAATRVGVFYGQSASLVRYLVDRGGPKQFVDFLSRAELQGYDAALRGCYGLQDVGALDRVWSRRVQIATGTARDNHLLELAAN